MSQIADERISSEQLSIAGQPRLARSRSIKRTVRRVSHTLGVYALVLPGAILFILPLLWMLSTALKEPNQIFIFPPQWIPDPIRWENFVEGWSKHLPFNLFLKNTVIITFNAVAGQLVSCTLAAYGFARLRARGKEFFFILVLATMILPIEVIIIPRYILFTELGWNNTHLPLMVPQWFGWPFFIFLLRQFFMGIPMDLDEAARIDGANSWQILWHIIVPLSKPALATVVIFTFIGNWNSFLEPLVYLRDTELLTIAIGLLQFQGAFGYVDFHLMMAVALLSILPVLVIFFFGQKTFVQGIALTGIKG